MPDTKVVVEVLVDGVDQGVEQFVRIVLPVDVDVLRRARALTESEIECEAALQHPLIARDGCESGE